MAISLSDLSPKAREQATIKLAILEARKRQQVSKAAAPPYKENKYHAEKTVVDGMEFDSAKEARRWSDLFLMQKAGEIVDLSRQVEYELIPKQVRSDGKTERAVKYVADFVYTRTADGETVVEDVKGFKRGQAYAMFVIKRKLMKYLLGIEVQEV